MAPNPVDAIDGKSSAHLIHPKNFLISSENLKATIQSLYSLQSSTHAYLGPETQQALIQNIHQLTSSLQSLVRNSPSVPTLLPPEIIEYVDSARNPDIYTREFVELVQRGNAYLRGKSEALQGFRDALAEEMVREWPEMEGLVGKVVEGKGEGVTDALQPGRRKESANGTKKEQA